jgi:hypothetical protein
MNRFSLYILLVMIYLGLSKSFAPAEQRTDYIPNEKYLSTFFTEAPTSVMLVDLFETGFLIKTHFFRLRIFRGFGQPDEIVVRTSRAFWDANANNLGMNLFRRFERDNHESIIPMPPGVLFIGDPAYGRWDYESSGRRVWFFHRAYRHFPDIFYWGDFRPDYEFFQKMKIHLTNDKPFYGPQDEFGSNGSVTKKFLKAPEQALSKQSPEMVKLLKKYLDLPSNSDQLAE